GFDLGRAGLHARSSRDYPCCTSASAMPTKKYFLSLVDLGREIRRPSLVGMQFFHKGVVSAGDLFSGRARFNAKDLISLLVSHFSVAANMTSVFFSIIISRVFTPVRLSPVQVSGEQRAA